MQETEQTAAGRVVDEIFLSPRVVDAATLREFAESLSTLIHRAAEQREHLLQAVAHGEGLATSLKESSARAAEKLRPAVKLVPTIDAKLEQARAALELATKAAATAEETAKRAPPAARREDLAAAENAARSLGEATKGARALEAKLAELSGRAEQAANAIDAECKARLDAASAEARTVLGSIIAEIDARAARTAERLRAISGKRSEPRLPIEEEGRITPAEETDTSGAPNEETLFYAYEHADEEIEKIIADVRSRVTKEARSLESKAEKAVQIAEAAEERLAAAQRELAGVDERGREIAAMASQALEAFDEEIGSRMRTVRELMEQLASVADQSPRPTPWRR